MAENGAVMLRRDGDALRRDFAQDEATRARQLPAPAALCAARVLRGRARRARWRATAPAALTDIAVDHSEFAHLDDRADRRTCVALMRAHGLNATVSSIHVNGWIGAHNKWSGARWAVQRAARRCPRRRAEWLYVGDSTNDQVMFEHLPLSVGVANSARFADAAARAAGLRHARRARRGLRRGGAAPARRRGARMNDRPHGRRAPAATAAALALGAAVSLGLARFSYALLLPPMRADLGWSYLTAGAMNTVNAAGYLVGALLLPRAAARAATRAPVARPAALATALLLAAHGLVLGDAALYAAAPAVGRGQRRRPSSAAACSPRGWLGAGRCAPAAPSAALVLGLYYGGTGLGIIVSALLVPPLTALRRAACLAAGLAGAGRGGAAGHGADGARPRARWPRRAGRAARRAPVRAARAFAFGLAGYLMFGLGYIGYMTFIVTLLREQGMARPRRSSRSTCCSAPAWWPRRGCGPGCCSAFAAAGRWRC